MSDALRQAAQAVLDRWDSPQWEWRQHGPTADLMAALRAALAQPPAPTADQIERAQAIAAAFSRGHDAGWQSCAAQSPAPTTQPATEDDLRVYDAIAAGYAQPVQQPTADVHWCATWLRNNYQEHPSISGLCDAMKEAAYTQAAPAERQPLSDEQINAIGWQRHGGADPQEWFRNAARAIEAAHGIATAKGEKL